VCHQGLDQFKFVGVHVLGLINHQHGFRDAAGFHLAVADPLDGGLQDFVRLFQATHPAQQVEAIGVESFDLNEVGGVSNKREQAFFEFGGGSPRKREHKQLFVLHVFHKDERSQLVHQHLGFATTGAGGHHDVFGGVVVNDGQLGGREGAEQLLELGRRHLQRQGFGLLTGEILAQKGGVVQPEIVFHKLKGGLVVFDHLGGVLAHDVYLLHLVFVKPVEGFVVFLGVLLVVVGFQPFDGQAVVQHKETAFQLDGLYPRQVKQGILDVVHADGLVEKQALAGLKGGFELLDGKLHQDFLGGIFGGSGQRGLPVLEANTRLLPGLSLTGSLQAPFVEELHDKSGQFVPFFQLIAQ